MEFRPHHFLCTVGFMGKGYSNAFVANYQRLADELRRAPGGDRRAIQVAAQTDSICGPCPNRAGTLCQTQEKIDRLDAAHAAVLQIRPGDTLTWGEAKRRIVARFTDEAFEKACAPCAWKPLGICHDALRKLRAAFSEEGRP